MVAILSMFMFCIRTERRSEWFTFYSNRKIGELRFFKDFILQQADFSFSSGIPGKHIINLTLSAQYTRIPHATKSAIQSLKTSLTHQVL
jgi:hypothetical protein